MKHEFTDKQITTAANKSLFHYGEYNSERGYSWSMTAESLRSFLDALPEPAAYDWQECRFEDIRKGDRVKVVDTHEAGDQTVYEGDVVQVSKGLVVTAHHQLHSVYNSKWYRIPAPVQHPDPEKHPVIIDEAGRPWFSAGLDEYHSPHQHSIFRNPRDFENWTPGKVVEDDR